MMKQQVTHPFAPVWDKDSEILILGTFPSVKSRENLFYYGHPRNRFWQVLAEIRGESVPVTVEEKKAFLKRQHIALWDVIQACEIENSADSSIGKVIPNDIEGLLKQSNIRTIICNGQKAKSLFDRYFKNHTAISLPSTSPANARIALSELTEIWRKELS